MLRHPGHYHAARCAHTARLWRGRRKPGVCQHVACAARSCVRRSALVRTLGDWKTDLQPHYATARRMLGVTEARCLTETDEMLREIANDLGRGDTFTPTQVGVYFGEAGKTVSDPYFQGAGPDRSGCTECGACMTGCKHNAKNTLDKNYLYLAEQCGAVVVPETEVKAIRELPEGGYEVETSRITDLLFKRPVRYQARGIVMAGGVLGTVPLLLKCKRAAGYRESPGRSAPTFEPTAKHWWGAAVAARPSIIRAALPSRLDSSWMTTHMSRWSATAKVRTSCRY